MRTIRKDLIDEIVVEINLYKKSDKRLNMKQREKMLKKVGLNFKKPQVIYLSGKISGDKNYKEKFEKYKKKFTAEGYIVLNPAEISLPEYSNSWYQYMMVCLNLLKNADIIFLLDDYKDSTGALIELEFAKKMNKTIWYYEEKERLKIVGYNY
ncbi:hypothetical protein HMPREF3181_00909 [Parvimonas sp. KA00067]|uniref:DUF4406 domain-containing protein n=1 Tax=Parvimonas sp. KA00067 TaxID=1588755 RepID=UPI0007949F73|nr:DUF4406 domain-containing protein [Parvimonas sp. KA00067]KXB66164.1 hypothetical protein HMPREF3181_00909 [Parvimonas sp. KA00067]